MDSLKMDIDDLRGFLSETFPQVADALDLRGLTPDGLTLALRVDDRHLRPGGTVSGPSMFMLADVGVYLAILSRIGREPLAVTTNCTMDFLQKPGADLELLADVEILKLGRRLAVGDVRLWSGASRTRLVARAGLTYFIP